MKSNVIMDTIDRELCGINIQQRTKDSFLNLGDILYILDTQRIKERKRRINFSAFLQLENIQCFLQALEKEINAKPYLKATKSSPGWIHPFFAIKILTHFNPKFEIQVYKWLFDYLISNRISSADSYVKMCGVLYKYARNKANYNVNIKRVSNKIKELIRCDNWNKATQIQLQERDYLQNLITDMTNTFKDSELGLNTALKTYIMRIKV